MEKDFKLNYPIKYAIMPVEEHTGWAYGIHELVRDYSVVAYIAMKCRIVKEVKKYFQDGSFKTTYEVVFLYDRKTLNSCFEPNKPHFNFDGDCTDTVVVDAIFDDFATAKDACIPKNKKILSTAMMGLSLGEDLEREYRELLDHHDKTLAKYGAIESSVEEATKDEIILKDETCQIDQSEEVGVDESGKEQGSDCISWENHEPVGRQFVLGPKKANDDSHN